MIKRAGWGIIVALRIPESLAICVARRCEMPTLAKKTFFAFLFSCLACGAGWAQVTAQISGSVKDASGAVLPGVEVTATQTATGLVRTVVTNETRSYVLPNLPVGPYKVDAALPGFRSFSQTGIVLTVDANPALNITLQV